MIWLLSWLWPLGHGAPLGVSFAICKSDTVILAFSNARLLRQFFRQWLGKGVVSGGGQCTGRSVILRDLNAF